MDTGVDTGVDTVVAAEGDTGVDTGSGIAGEMEEIGEVVQQTEAEETEDKMEEGDTGD